MHDQGTTYAHNSRFCSRCWEVPIEWPSWFFTRTILTYFLSNACTHPTYKLLFWIYSRCPYACNTWFEFHGHYRIIVSMWRIWKRINSSFTCPAAMELKRASLNPVSAWMMWQVAPDGLSKKNRKLALLLYKYTKQSFFVFFHTWIQKLLNHEAYVSSKTIIQQRFLCFYR